MKYISTRNAESFYSAPETIVKGIADDGGLFVPSSFPTIDGKFISDFEELSYPERVAKVLHLYMDEFSYDELLSYANKAYSRFDGDPCPVVKIEDALFVMELWHGPTFAFKDMALTMLPHLCGSTMPKYNPEARGSFTGLTTEHTRGHFARSIMESLSYTLKSNFDYLNVDVSEIRAMGGGANSDLWCQMKADMTGKKLVTLKNKETACLGAAILAGVGIGALESVEKACEYIKIDKVYKPRNVDYTKGYENFLNADKILNV